MILEVLVSMVLMVFRAIPTVELAVVTDVTLVVTSVGVGVDTVGGGTGVSGAVSESTIAVIGELEKALLEDCEESSSLSVSDSEVFSCSSSMGSSSSSFNGVPSDLELGRTASSSCGGVEEPSGMESLTSVSVVSVWPCVPGASVVAVVVLSEAGEVGDLSSLNPLSSDRIFVLLELMLLLEDADDEEELEDAVDEELLLLVLAGHFLIGSSESVSLVLSSVCNDRDEMSVLLEVRRLDEDVCGWPPRVTGRRWPLAPPADAGDLFRAADVLGVVDRGELVVAADVGVLPEMSPFELLRILLDVLGVVAVAAVADGGPDVEFAALAAEDPGGPPVELLLRSRGGGAFLLLWLLLSDLPFLVLLLVRFSATRSFRTHSSYLVFHPV